MIKNFKNQIFLLGLLLILVIIVMIYTFTQTKRSTTQPPITPAYSNLPNVDQRVEPQQAQSEAQQSTEQIQKLENFLPYKEQFATTGDIPLEIYIPNSANRDSFEILDINVFGLNYNVTEEEPEYNNMKAAFLEAQNKVFSWISSQGADPAKILISWGDRKFIRDKVKEWQENQ